MVLAQYYVITQKLLVTIGRPILDGGQSFYSTVSSTLHVKTTQSVACAVNTLLYIFKNLFLIFSSICVFFLAGWSHRVRGRPL